MIEALNSSETTVLTRVTQRNIPEDAIIHKCISDGLLIVSRNLLGMSEKAVKRSSEKAVCLGRLRQTTSKERSVFWDI
jgi:hypothetical protein